MTYDSGAKIVTENSDPAVIDEAICYNGATICEANKVEASALNEQKQLYGQETGTFNHENSAGLLEQISSSGINLRSTAKAKGSTEAGVYGDVAFEAAGLGPITQGVKTVCEIIGDNDPFKHGSCKTFDQIIKEGAGKTPLVHTKTTAGKGNIFTGPFNVTAALEGRAQGINDFMQGDKVKGVKSSPEKVSELSKKCEMVVSAKIRSEQHLGNALAADAKVGAGAKIAKAQQFGFSPMAALRHQGPGSGPKFREPRDEAISDSTTTDWG